MNLNPVGYVSSSAIGVNGNQVVGFGQKLTTTGTNTLLTLTRMMGPKFCDTFGWTLETVCGGVSDCGAATGLEACCEEAAGSETGCGFVAGAAAPELSGDGGAETGAAAGCVEAAGPAAASCAVAGIAALELSVG